MCYQEFNNLAITMNDQGARSTQTSGNCRGQLPHHWFSSPMEPSLTWDHSGDIASNTTTISHHHHNGNLIPPLPCYYKPDFNLV